jgi:hypothetical protein
MLQRFGAAHGVFSRSASSDPMRLWVGQRVALRLPAALIVISRSYFWRITPSCKNRDEAVSFEQQPGAQLIG